MTEKLTSEFGNIFIGGHRGMGCTDHDFYQDRDIRNLPVENTVESIAAAFNSGADYVEFDAVMSGDGELFTLHNVVPKDHFFGASIPGALLNTMPFTEISKFTTGRHSAGKLTKLGDVLHTVACVDPHTADFCVNIEIKGVQGSGQPFESNNYLQALADSVKSSDIAIDRVLFSSFSLQNILRMAHLIPSARYGMLFAEKPESRPIYADHQDDVRYRYLPFDAQHIDQVLRIWKEEAPKQAKLSYAHPEIQTVSDANIDLISKARLGLNTWGLFEKLPPERQDLYLRTAQSCGKKGIPMTVITDYIDDARRLFRPTASI